MKKWIVWLFVILVLTIGCIYIFIPAKIVISALNTAMVTTNGAYRFISEEEKWKQWWRNENGKPHILGQPFSYNESTFRLIKHANNTAGIEIVQNRNKLLSLLHLVSFNLDSTGIIWSCEMPVSYNPVTRLMNYENAVKIKKDMTGVMKSFTSFISDPHNVYGITILRTSTTDTTLLSARFVSRTYPTTVESYQYFSELEKSVKKQNGKISGFPMMNVRRLDDGSFESQVAIPTNLFLANDGKIESRRMVPGNFITAEIHGGPYTVNEAINQMNYFISEYNKAQIANPFQLLVTNRLSESDTTKWITRLYVPVVK
jgi:hypothetical protein